MYLWSSKRVRTLPLYKNHSHLSTTLAKILWPPKILMSSVKMEHFNNQLRYINWYIQLPPVQMKGSMESLFLGLLLSNFGPTYPHPGFTRLRGTGRIFPPLLKKMACPPSRLPRFCSKNLYFVIFMQFCPFYPNYQPTSWLLTGNPDTCWLSVVFNLFYVTLPKVLSIFSSSFSSSSCYSM